MTLRSSKSRTSIPHFFFADMVLSNDSCAKVVGGMSFIYLVITAFYPDVILYSVKPCALDSYQVLNATSARAA